MRTVEVLSAKILHRYRIFEIVEQELRLPSGRTVVRQVVKHPGAVVIIPQLADGRLLLIEQYRFAVGEALLEFPAGTLEPGEEPLPCARRELIEETGYRADHWRALPRQASVTSSNTCLWPVVLCPIMPRGMKTRFSR